MAITHTEYGKFINHYRALDRAGHLATTPMILSEGDSWFSTPLYYNLVDWLEVRAPNAVFMRMENSGDLAVDMFSGGNLRSIGSRLKAFEFDVLLLSAGGNDFVDRFLRDAFKNSAPMSAEEALERVVATGRYDEVLRAYQRMLDAAFKARPSLRVVTHSYDYPRLMGEPAQLSVEQIGLVALFKRSIGDWIARYVRHVLPTEALQLAFAKQLIDAFFERVLTPLKTQYGDRLDVVDFRGLLTQDAQWNDEMHPSGAGFERLADVFRVSMRAALPALKRAGLG
jgi:hypothetical protein